MNDNGGTGGVDVYNAGMRGKKGSNYDGGHRAACFIRWPGGKLISPQNLSYATQIQDLLPTFINLFKFKVSPHYHFDGENQKAWQIIDEKISEYSVRKRSLSL